MACFRSARGSALKCPARRPEEPLNQLVGDPALAATQATGGASVAALDVPDKVLSGIESSSSPEVHSVDQAGSRESEQA